ncbi:hypothetical protein lilo_1277 [Lactococcus lactis subsp. lactis IO-1]|nr:hypothetical protein lilo_1277 [Lactococcus lactis subsp. lactis IO-1]
MLMMLKNLSRMSIYAKPKVSQELVKVSLFRMENPYQSKIQQLQLPS